MSKQETLKIEDIISSMKLNQKKIVKKVNTDLLPLDYILGGGIRNESITQLVGEHSTGKTSIALEIALAFCKMGKKVLYVDSENTLTESKLRDFNLDDYNNEFFFYCNISMFSKVEELMDKFISTGEISLIIVDSIASLINEGYLNITGGSSKKSGISITNNNSNYDSRPLGLFLKKYEALANTMGFSMLLINQYRCKIDKRVGTISSRYGPKYLDNICNTIIKIKSSSSSDYAKQLSCLKNCCIEEFEVIKSDCLSPKTTVPFCFEYGKGINEIYDTVYFMIHEKIIAKNGTYYSIGNSAKCNGLSNLIEAVLPYIKQYYARNKSSIMNFYQDLFNVKC